MNHVVTETSRQIGEYDLLRQKTLRLQAAAKQPLGADPALGKPEEDLPNIFGTLTISAIGVDVHVDLEMKFNTGEKFSCKGPLTGFGFCGSASVFNAYWNERVSPQWIQGKTGFVQLAAASGTGEVTLWLDNVLLAVIPVIGIGAGFVGAAGPIKFEALR